MARPGRGGREGETRTDGIVLHHAERSVRARAPQRAVVACQGHGDEADGDGAGFGCSVRGGGG